MISHSPTELKLGIVGATGITGGFAFAHAQLQGLEPIVIGRDGKRLREFAARHDLPASRLRVADAHDSAALRQAFVGLTHVISAVAPFAQHGFEVAKAAAQLGLGYTDSTGEAGFMLRLIDELDTIAQQSGATLCTGNGASAFLGDVAIRWIVPSAGDAGKATILYDIRGYQPTLGSLESYLTSILPGGGPALRDGKIMLLPFGSFAGSVRNRHGISGIFPDAIVISRYWPAMHLDVLLQGSVRTRGLAKAVARFVCRPHVRNLVFRLPLQKWLAYDADKDQNAIVTAYAEAIDSNGARRSRAVQARGVYPATGQILVATMQAMARRGPRPSGIRAASVMFASFAEVLELSGIRELENDKE